MKLKNLFIFLLFSLPASAQLVNGCRGFAQPNDASTGTTLYGTAIINTSGNAINAGTTNTTVQTYIVCAGAGKSGNAALASQGTLAPCTMDSTVASGAGGDYVINSPTTASECHAQANAPTPGTWIIGYLAATSTAIGVAADVGVNSSTYIGISGATSGPVYNSPTGLEAELFPVDVGPNSTCGGLCNATDPEDVKIHDVLNTVWISGMSPEMDGTGYPISSTPIVWNTNPWNGIDKSFVFHQGLYTIDACVPIALPSLEYQWDGMLETQQAGLVNSVIRAAPNSECTGGGAFPNSTNQLTWTYHHGPYSAGTIVALIYADGMATGGTGPTWTANSFAHRFLNLTIDANCEANFGIYTAGAEEHTLWDNLIIRNYGTGTTSVAGQMFYDREQNPNLTAQAGPGNGSFHMIQGPPCSTQTANTAHGIVIEGANAVVDLTGGGGSGATAYVNGITIGGGTCGAGVTCITSIALGYQGTGYTSNPTCTIYASNGTGATCTAAEVGGAVTSVTLTANGTGYVQGALEVGGPFQISADTGISSSAPSMKDFVWIEGAPGASVGPMQCQQETTACIQLGAGGAVQPGGLITSVISSLENGSNTAALIIGPGADGNQLALNLCKSAGDTKPLVIDQVNGVTVNATTTNECIPKYSEADYEFGQQTVVPTNPLLFLTATGNALQNNAGGQGAFAWISGFPVLSPGGASATNESLAETTTGPIIGNGISYGISSTAAPSGSLGLQISNVSATGFSFDTTAKGNAAANITATNGIFSGQVKGAGFIDTTIGLTTTGMSSQSTATPTNITNMTWTTANSKNYNLSCDIPITFAASATVAFALANSSGNAATAYTLDAKGSLGTAGVWGEIGTYGQTAWGTSTGASGAVNGTVTVHVYANIQNANNSAGTMTLQTIANGTNNITVLKNATCSLVQTN